jgi:hypothetical protein
MNPSSAPREGSKAARRALDDGVPAGGGGTGGAPREALRAFRWLDLGPLWESRNDRIARLLDDPTNALRRRWMLWLREQGLDGDPTVSRYADRDRVSVAIVGDPGEGDQSQRAVVGPLLAVQDECDFLVICSDVVYPAGDVNGYVDNFYAPYAGWTKPIYALPGNHDWYDELEGFMFHFCGVDPPPAGIGTNPPRPALWRKPRSRRRAADERREGRPEGRGDDQPAPYFMLDGGPVALVCIDTGITGVLDREQGEWLRRVSETVPKPKLLLTGKPLIVDGSYHPGLIDRFDRTVDAIVRTPEHGYVAAIGGDIHNYQRYPVRVGDRYAEYVVAGGGGAFMHATHRIGRVDLGETKEADFHCFPLRGDSMQFYSRVVVAGLRRLVWLARLLPLAVLLLAAAIGVLLTVVLGISPWILVAVALLFALPAAAGGLACYQVHASGASRVLRLPHVELTAEQASAWMADKLDEDPAIGESVELTGEQRELAEFVAPRAPARSSFLQSLFSEVFDVDRPPLYKQFLRLDADRDKVRLTCCAAIGTEQEGQPPHVEEWVEIPLAPARAAMGLPED